MVVYGIYDGHVLGMVAARVLKHCGDKKTGDIWVFDGFLVDIPWEFFMGYITNIEFCQTSKLPFFYGNPDQI